jgi:hypothetical protein
MLSPGMILNSVVGFSDLTYIIINRYQEIDHIVRLNVNLRHNKLVCCLIGDFQLKMIFVLKKQSCCCYRACCPMESFSLTVSIGIDGYRNGIQIQHYNFQQPFQGSEKITLSISFDKLCDIFNYLISFCFE